MCLARKERKKKQHLGSIRHFQLRSNNGNGSRDISWTRDVASLTGGDE